MKLSYPWTSSSSLRSALTLFLLFLCSFLQPIENLNTDYGHFVVSVLPRMTRQSQSLDQSLLRQYIGLSSSFLVSDTTTDPDRGMSTWSVGFSRLVDIVVALHAREELELETVNTASKACSECWSVGGSWKGLEECREVVRKVAVKLQRLLDEGGRTYRGERVYAPGP